jgi:hypothetical protein
MSVADDRLTIAEHSVAPSRTFRTVEAIAAFIGVMAADPVLGDRFPDAELDVEVRITPQLRRFDAMATRDGLLLFRPEPDAMTIAHEYAHRLTANSGHDARWLDAYLWLVRRYVSVLHWAELAHALDHCGHSARSAATDFPDAFAS